MGVWIALSLWVAANSNVNHLPTLTHVRTAEAEIRELIADGYVRSATFRQLVDGVEGLSCVVYIARTARLSQGMNGALLHSAVGRSDMPILRILLKASLSGDEAIATIGHELQHVVEADGASNARAIAAAFDELDSTARTGSIRKYETEAAVDITWKVRTELRRAARRR